MRILAYKPEPPRQTVRMDRLIRCEPLELEYLYTALAGYDVRLLDGADRGADPVGTAVRWQPHLVLITAYVTSVDAVRTVAQRIKRAVPDTVVLAGGPHAEVVPEHFDDNAIDGTAFADQLTAVRTAADRICAGLPFDDVPGLACRKDGTFVRNMPQGTPAEPPVPDRVLFRACPERYRYLYFGACASVKTAAGCTGGCTFCFCRRMNGGRYIPRPMASVVAEIAGLPAKNVFILDDDFFADADRVREFCRLIRGRGMHKRFIAYGSARAVTGSPELVGELRAAGLRALITGFEYVDDSALRAVHKRSAASDNDTVVELCRLHGIDLFALFMVGPGFRHRDFLRLVRYVRTRGITFATFSTETPFPEADTCTDGRFWRYDLLRLHERPRHMTAASYYLWLYFLYLVPLLRPAGMLLLMRRYGLAGSLKATMSVVMAGTEYLFKLIRWR